jgi:glycerate 2-kinase
MQILNMDDIATSPGRKYALEKIEHVINSLNPGSAIEHYLDADMDNFDHIYVIGFGKASFSMYSGIRDKVAGKLSYAGIIVPEDEKHGENFPELDLLMGNHPYVSSLSVDSSKKLLSHVIGLSENDLVIVLISGGGSSLFEIPENGVSVEDIKDISKEIMENDGDIYTLNHIRSSMSSVKNGKLARHLYPAYVRAFIVSDVVFDDLNIIASGPLVQQPQVRGLPDIIEKYVKDSRLKAVASRAAVSGNLEDKYFAKVTNTIILKNRDFVDALYSELEGEKINLGSNVNGDVNVVSKRITDTLKGVWDIKGRGFWFVCGGETTVNVTGTGSGGRNQELVLRMMEYMSPAEIFTFISIGTDGIDGKSIAAGGIVDNTTKIEGLDKYLENNDSYSALSTSHGAIITGRTGNNVSDIILGFYSIKNDNF